MTHPFQALSADPAGDYRGSPTFACPCGCNMLLMAAVFDQETRLPGMYLLDAMCVRCGSLVTIPTPVDEGADDGVC